MKIKLLTVITIGVFLLAFTPVINAACGACGGEGDHHRKGEHKKTECNDGKCKMDKIKGEKASESHGEHQGDSRAEITINVLAKMLEANAVPVLFDARSDQYDDGRRIPGAKQLTSAASEKKIAQMIPNKNTLVITYCANPQCPASSKLAERLHKLGYKNVLELPAGIEGWIEAGHKIKKVK